MAKNKPKGTQRGKRSWQCAKLLQIILRSLVGSQSDWEDCRGGANGLFGCQSDHEREQIDGRWCFSEWESKRNLFSRSKSMIFFLNKNLVQLCCDYVMTMSTLCWNFKKKSFLFAGQTMATHVAMSEECRRPKSVRLRHVALFAVSVLHS